jgi:galactosylceramidase
MKHFPRRLLSELLLGLGLALLCTDALAAQTVPISGTDMGSVYEGIGAVSGGGATSVLLHDYVEPQRSQILDYLFKPNYGAGIQELYVEVGGDGNSTQGSEPSHMRSATDQNYNRGYEWWLMEQAKARNPAIQLDVTAWSAPHWLGNGNFWSQDTANYLANFVSGAKSAHNLDINYIGCRNEKGIDEAWAELFHTTLTGAGLTQIGIHAFDNWEATDWSWVTDMETTPALAGAVYAIGEHTTAAAFGGTPPPANIQAAAKTLGKSIWDTEEHVYEHGFQCAIDIAKAYMQNYVSSGITKTIYWYLITAFYPVEPQYDVTMAVASSPWSGNYTINPALWGYAHLTQFAQPGWKFLNNATGTLTGGGNFITLLSANGTDFSVVAETEGATAAQQVTFNLSGGLAPTSMNVWRSDTNAQFQQQTAIPVTNGSFTISMEANAIYSITTTTGQQKGTAPAAPAAAAFPFPYYENYDHYGDFIGVGYRPYYHADIAATFELAQRPDGTGQCLHQVIAQPAQSWAPESNPYTIVGDGNWKNYEVSVDTSIETTGWASLMGRINSVGTGYGTVPSAYYLTLDTTGAWTFNTSSNSAGKSTQLSSGTATLAAGTWHNMKLVFQGTSIKGLIDATQVFSITDTTYNGGPVGLGTQSNGGAYTTAFFDNLIVNTVGGATPTPTVFVQDTQNSSSSSSSSSSGTATSSSSSSASATSSSSGSGAATSSSSSSGTTNTSSPSSGATSSSTSSGGGTSSGATSSITSGGGATSSSSSGGTTSSSTSSSGATSSSTSSSGAISLGSTTGQGHGGNGTTSTGSGGASSEALTEASGSSSGCSCTTAPQEGSGTSPFGALIVAAFGLTRVRRSTRARSRVRMVAHGE